jgi:hypothetical protein
VKFKPGDPVWARSNGYNFPVGEYTAIVIRATGINCPNHSVPYYDIEIETVPLPAGFDHWVICERFLRPRRDDYQQHEPRVSQEDLLKSIQKPVDLTEESLEEILEQLHEELAKR